VTRIAFAAILASILWLPFVQTAPKVATPRIAPCPTPELRITNDEFIILNSSLPIEAQPVPTVPAPTPEACK
jgi:hypothetical protein